MRIRTKTWIVLGVFALSIMGAASAEAARYSAIVHQAQSQVKALGHDPGVLDGIMGRNTMRGIRSYQASKGLRQSGDLDSATLQSLSIGVSTDLVNNIQDWQAVPNQAELDELKEPVNVAANAYADYRPQAPAAGLDLPGRAILAAMNRSADQFGSRGPGQPKHTQQGFNFLTGCLKTGHFPDHWSDITIHYYCQMSLPRRCYTNALAGKSTGGRKLSRPMAYDGCANGKLPDAAGFQWVKTDQPLIFQYVMFAQTHAFDHEQEQAIINAFYGVKNPTNRSECRNRRPLRTEDPTDGTHCLVDKEMARKLVGRSR